MCEGDRIAPPAPPSQPGRRITQGKARQNVLPRSLAAIVTALVVAMLSTHAAAGAPGLEAAGPTSAASPIVTMDADAGWAGLYRPGRPLPVRVNVTSDTALTATLSVTVKAPNGGTTVTSTSVNTKAGEPSFSAFAVASPEGATTLPVAVTLVAGTGATGATIATGATGAVLSRAVVLLTPVGNDEVVGVLAGADDAALPSTVPLTPPVGLAHLVRLDAGSLEAGALGPLGTVVGTPGGLASLADAPHAALLAWVAGGGRLLVSGGGEAPIDALPATWRPSGPAGHLPAGLGEIWRTTADLAGRHWEGVLAPTSTVAPAQPALFEASYAAAGPPAAALMHHTKVGLPSVAVLAAVGAGWALLMCVLFVWLRRSRRPALAWAAAVLLAGAACGALVASRTSLQPSATGQFSWRLSSPGGGPGGAWIGRTSRTASHGAITLPAGWSGANDSNFGFGLPGAEVHVTEPAGSGAARHPRATLVGSTAGFAALHAFGPVTSSEELSVSATAQSGSITGTVANHSTQTLEQVAVFVGGRAVPVGAVAAGATASWHIATADAASGSELNVPAERSAWQVGIDPANAPAPVDLAVWGALRRALGPNLLSPGTATAVGWSAVGAGGPAAAAPAGSHAVVAAAPVTRDQGETGPTGWDVRRRLLREDATPNGPATALVSFELATPSPPSSDLELLVPPVATQLEVWTGERWETLDPPDPLDPRGASQPVRLPASTVEQAGRTGVVYARLTIDPAAVGLTTSAFVLRAAP